MSNFYFQHQHKRSVDSGLEQVFHHEPAVLVKDIDVINMEAVVKLKRKLIMGEEPRIKAPGEDFNPKSNHRGAEADSPTIFRCNVMHGKNRYGHNRIRYKEGDDVMVVFTNRSKEELVQMAGETDIDPKHKRMHFIQDAFVDLAYLCDEGEPRNAKTMTEEIPLEVRMPQYGGPGDDKTPDGTIIPIPGEAGLMRSDDWVHYWGRPGAGYNARIYTTKEGDHVIHPAIGRNVYLEEQAKYNILFAQPVRDDHNNHGNFGLPGPGDPICLPFFHYFPVKHWSMQHWVDNAFTI